MFTVLSVVYLWSDGGGGHLSPVAPPTPFVAADPASDARLADYDTAHDQAAKTAAPGARCEQLAAAYDMLTPDDLKRGRNIVASSRARITALADVQVCHDEIAKSNQHFDTLERLVAAAQANAAPQALVAAFDSTRSLDAFDRSRTRYQSDVEAINQGQRYGAELADSDGRLAAMQAASNAYQRDGSAETAGRAADALSRLTPLDRARLTGPQQAALAAVTEAARRVQEARAHLSRVARLFAAVQATPTTYAQQQLIDAMAAVTAFDQAVATPDQRQSLDQARAAAVAGAWIIGHQRVAGLGKDAKPEQLAAAAAVYDVLKDLPRSGLTNEQRETLAQAKSAADTLHDSDARRQAMMDAYSAWQQSGLAAGDAVVPDVAAITPFDQGRFTAPERNAWAALVKADAILRGPELGFTAATKDRMPIFAQGGGSDLEARAATTLANTLRRAGLVVANNQGDAALILSVTLSGSDPIQQDLSSGFFAWTTVTHMGFKLAWAVDGSVLLQGDVAQPGRSQDKTAVQAQAILADINLVAGKIEDAAKR